MLIAMMLSMLNVAAFAEVFDSDGQAVSGNSGDSGLVVSADPEAPSASSGTGSSSASSGESAAAASIPADSGSAYSILTTSASALEYFSSEAMLEENPMVYYNAKYIVYIREHLEELKESNPEVVETAYALFGEKYIDMKFSATTTSVSKSVALKAQKESLEKVISALEALSAAPEDADAILAVRKAAASYCESFTGTANYDCTAEDCAFASASAALAAAKAELESLKTEIAKLEAEASSSSSTTAAASEESPAASATPAPEATPTPNEAQLPDASEPAVLTASPLSFFSNMIKLFTKATPLTFVSDYAGKTATLTETQVITGLPYWEIIVTLDNAVLTAPAGQYAFAVGSADTVLTIEACTIKGKAIDCGQGNVTLKYVNIIDDTVPTSAAPATVWVHDSGKLEIGNCEISSSQNCCVYTTGGSTAINGYNKLSASATNAINCDGGSLRIDNTGTTQSIISAVKASGLNVNGGEAVAAGNAKISGLNGVNVENGKFTMGDNVRIDAIGSGESYAAVNNQGGQVYITGGELYAEYCKAISSANYQNTYVSNGEWVIKTSKLPCKAGEDYTTGIITVNGTAVATMADANAKIAAASAGDSVTVKLLGDVEETAALTISSGADVSVIGNGHSFKGNGIVVSAGSASISGITVEAANALTVSGGTVSVNDGTVLKASSVAITASGSASVSVNDAVLYGVNAFNISAPAKVTVNSCKDNCQNPIGTAGSVESKDNLLILGGYYLYLYSDKTPENNNTYVAYYVPSGIAAVSTTADSSGYYKVSMEYVPTVALVNGTTGYDEDGIPYVVYDKANPKYITFNVDPKVLRIDGIPVNGGNSINIFNATGKGGEEGDIVIDIDAFHNNLSSGVYDLQFTFANGYVLTQKLHLYVLPETTKLVARENKKDASPDSVKASDIATAITEYVVGNKEYIYAETSELPTRIGVSDDPNGNEINWFGYYNKAVDGLKVLQKSDSKDYFILVDYAFLDQLSAGQDYVFLDFEGAVKRLNLKIINNNVSISPTSLDFWEGDSSAVFTVKPDFKDVYIDGVLVPTQFVSYNTDTNKLTINKEYLCQLEDGDHLMEVETSKGWLSASINTGVALRPIDVDYHVYGGAKALAFQGSDVIDPDLGVYIGKNSPVKIDSSLLYFYDNNTKFTLSPSYLNRLSLGTYYISAYVWNGEDYEYTSTTFRIVSASSAAYNPSTGDSFNAKLWIGLAVAALAVIIVCVFALPVLKKKKAVEEPEEDTSKKE